MEIEMVCRDGGVNLESAVVSMVEALAVETALVVGKSVTRLLFAMASVSNETTVLPREERVNERDALSILSRSTPKTVPENRDDGETDDDEDDDEEDDAENPEDDGGEADLSGDGGKDEDGDDDDDPDDDVEANGEGGSDDDDDDDEDDEDDEDDDEDGEDEDEEEDEDEDEEEEIRQPPAKKRK